MRRWHGLGVPRSIVLALGMAALCVNGAGAFAQGFPSRPVRIIVPFAAGGAVDDLARIIGAKLAASFGQPVVVETHAGAGGNLGADVVAKSSPDGYTILQTTNGQAISPALYRMLPFDVVTDFIPVTQLVASTLVLVADPGLPGRLHEGTDCAGQIRAGKIELRFERGRQSAPSDHGNDQVRGRKSQSSRFPIGAMRRSMPP